MLGRSDDVLHDAITTRHRELRCAYAALLADVGTHDRTRAWRRMGARSEEDYLVRYQQLKWGTAKDWVRQARVIERHPELVQAFVDGDMSLDKFHAACRLAERSSARTMIRLPSEC